MNLKLVHVAQFVRIIQKRPKYIYPSVQKLWFACNRVSQISKLNCNKDWKPGNDVKDSVSGNLLHWFTQMHEEGWILQMIDRAVVDIRDEATKQFAQWPDSNYIGSNERRL